MVAEQCADASSALHLGVLLGAAEHFAASVGFKGLNVPLFPGTFQALLDLSVGFAGV